MSGYGIFESASTDGLEQEQRQVEASKALAVAMERVAQRFGPWLNQAEDRQDFNDRVALLKPQMMKVVDSAGVMPVAGVMRKVVGRQKTLWQQAQKTAGFGDNDGPSIYDNDENYSVETLLNMNRSFRKDYEQGIGGDDTKNTLIEINKALTNRGASRAYTAHMSKVAEIIDNEIQYSNVPDFSSPEDKFEYYRGDTEDPDYKRFIMEDPEHRILPSNPFQHLLDYENWKGVNASKTATETNESTSQGDELIPEDNWDGYLNEREVPETDEVRNRNFANKTASTLDDFEAWCLEENNGTIDRPAADRYVGGHDTQYADGDELMNAWNQSGDVFASKVLAAASWSKVSGPDSEIERWGASFPNGHRGEVSDNGGIGKPVWSVWGVGGNHIAGGHASSIEEAKDICEQKAEFYTIGSSRKTASAIEDFQEWWDYSPEGDSYEYAEAAAKRYIDLNEIGGSEAEEVLEYARKSPNSYLGSNEIFISKVLASNDDDDFIEAVLRADQA